MTLDLGFWLTTVGLLLDIAGAFTLAIFDLPRRGRGGPNRKARLVDAVQAKIVDWTRSGEPKFANLDDGLQALTDGRALKRDSPAFRDLSKIVFGGQVQPRYLLGQRGETSSIFFDKDEREVVFAVESDLPFRDPPDPIRYPIDRFSERCDNYARQRLAKAGSCLLISGFVLLLFANIYRAGV